MMHGILINKSTVSNRLFLPDLVENRSSLLDERVLGVAFDLELDSSLVAKFAFFVSTRSSLESSFLAQNPFYHLKLKKNT